MRRMAWAMPESRGATSAGRKVFRTCRDTARSPGIAQHRVIFNYRRLPKIRFSPSRPADCVAPAAGAPCGIKYNGELCGPGNAKPTPSLAANTWSEKRSVGCSPMPSAERSELLTARVCWFVAPVCEPEMDCLISGSWTGAPSPAAVCPLARDDAVPPAARWTVCRRCFPGEAARQRERRWL